MPPGPSFLDLPGEIRNFIYDFCRPSNWTADFNTNTDFIAPNLLLVNRQINQETHSLLYSQAKFNFIGFLDREVAEIADVLGPNQQLLLGHSFVCRRGVPYDFSLSPDEHLSTFLDKTGPRNGRWIKEIGIPFPSVYQRRDRLVGLDGVTARALDQLQAYCPNLKKLELGCESIIFSGDSVHAHYFVCSGEVHMSVLDLVVRRLRAVSSEMEVIFNMLADCDCLVRDEFTAKIAAYGWKVNVLYAKAAIPEDLFLPIYLPENAGSDYEDSDYEDSEYGDSEYDGFDYRDFDYEDSHNDDSDNDEIENDENDNGDNDDEHDGVDFGGVEPDDSAESNAGNHELIQLKQ